MRPLQGNIIELRAIPFVGLTRGRLFMKPCLCIGIGLVSHELPPTFLPK